MAMYMYMTTIKTAGERACDSFFQTLLKSFFCDMDSCSFNAS